jgi:hypothetical protein
MKINEITNESTKLDESLATAAIGGVKSAWQGLKTGFRKGWNEKRYTDPEINSPAFQAAIKNAELGKPVNTHILKPKVAKAKPKVANAKPRVIDKEKNRSYQATWRANRTPEKKALDAANARTKVNTKNHDMTPDERIEFNSKKLTVNKKSLAKKPPAQRKVANLANAASRKRSRAKYKEKYGASWSQMDVAAKSRDMSLSEYQQAILEFPKNMTYAEKMNTMPTSVIVRHKK